MTFESTLLLEAVERLKNTMDPTPGQNALFDDIASRIKEIGRFYPVADLTVELMRERGYDVTEKDAGVIEKIAEKIEMNEDELWGAVSIWAEDFGIRRIDGEDGE